ncbi:MAG TPA: NAD-dependent epimerase/dehydratase family protein [Ktedonobacterales bacterium]
MRVLITGATGFLGESLTRRLLAGPAPVRILARNASAARPLVEAGAELVPGDITNRAAVQRALDGVTHVYHLAGKLFIPGVPASEYQAIHVEGVRLLLDSIREAGTIERVVHCSTTGVLGVTGDQPADELAPYRPTNAYEATKMEGERLVRASIATGFPAAIVRPGLVYGPGDLHLLGFFRSIERGLFRPIGRAPTWVHPIYIEDMTSAIVQCGTDPRAVGEIFHIAGREPATLAELATTIAQALGVPPPRGHIPMAAAAAVAYAGDLLPASLRPMAPLTRSRMDFLTHSRRYNVSKAQRVLGYSADTPLPEGVARATAWYRQEGYLQPQRALAGALASAR